MDLCLQLLISLLDKTRNSCLNICHFTVQDLPRKFMATQLLFLENITVRQTVKESPLFYETRSFITTSTRVCQINPVQVPIQFL